MKSKTEKTYQYILERIMNSTYTPSQRLIETQLSEEIGVSRNTVREALVMLEQERLVVSEKNKGVFVRVLSLKEVLEILEIRERLEGLIIRSTVRNISDEKLEELSLILKDMEVYLENNQFDEYSLKNREYHNVIYETSDKPYTVELVRAFKTQLVRLQFRTILVPGRNEQSVQEHRDIYEAIKNKKEEEAEQAIRKHINNVSETIKNYYSFLI